MIVIPRTCILSQLLPLNEAKKIIATSFQAPDNQESVQVPDACGYVLAGPVHSRRTLPPLLLGGPDGIAVKSAETAGAGEENVIELEASRVNTGMPMPEGSDAVIPVEEVTKVAENRYRIHTQVSPYQNTIQKGSDIAEGDLVMDRGHVITPFDIGALLTYGITEVSVKKWKVGLIATGDEIISPYTTPRPGQIVNSNSYMFAAFLKQSGITPVLYPIIPDDCAAIAAGVQKAGSECDMVLVFGGSSAGSKDFTVDALEKAGSVLFHGVAMGPGKPATLARVNGKPVVGMPGPSISAMNVLHELVYPLLRQWGVPVPPDTMVRGTLTRSVASFNGFDMFMMVKVEKNGEKTLITPISRTFGQMMGVRADAILHRAAGSGAFSRGDEVEVRMLRAQPSL